MESKLPQGSGAVDVLLASYAAGGLDPALHALVASHLAMSGRNRGFAGVLENLCGQRLREIEPKPMADRDACLAKVFAATPGDGGSPGTAHDKAFLPPPLRSFMRRNAVSLRWQPLLPGIEICRLESKEGTTTALYRSEPGRRFPAHSHSGMEVVLVLNGGFSDATGHYRRGDIAVAEAEVVHEPVADDDEDCICFVVTEGAVRLIGPAGA